MGFVIRRMRSGISGVVGFTATRYYRCGVFGGSFSGVCPNEYPPVICADSDVRPKEPASFASLERDDDWIPDDKYPVEGGCRYRHIELYADFGRRPGFTGGALVFGLDSKQRTEMRLHL